MDRSFPLVSIICLCYNHARYLREALNSVLAQTYPNIEIIIADDASTDGSISIINEYCAKFTQLTFIQNKQNQGNCASFNRAFLQSSGDYVIDFATDDILLPNRVASQVAHFQSLDQSFGVIYSDAELIDEDSKTQGWFYRKLTDGTLSPAPQSGYIYEQLLKRHFISAPTMMMKREVLEKLGGYDESLAYEDFDFWVRSAKYYQYFFQNEVLIKRRLHSQQLSKQLYLPQDRQLNSTVQVCYKAYALNSTASENQALAIRVKYELKHAFLTGHFIEARLLIDLLEDITSLNIFYRIIKLFILMQLRLPRPVYKMLVRLNQK